MVYAETEICQREWDAKISLGLWNTNKLPILSQKTKPSDNSAQSAGAGQYTDCISAAGQTPMSVLNMALNHQMVRSFEECAIAPGSTLTRSGSIWLGQIELFDI